MIRGLVPHMAGGPIETGAVVLLASSSAERPHARRVLVWLSVLCYRVTREFVPPSEPVNHVAVERHGLHAGVALFVGLTVQLAVLNDLLLDRMVADAALTIMVCS